MKIAIYGLFVIFLCCTACESEGDPESVNIVYTEIFRPSDWQITIKQPAGDTLSRAIFTGGHMRLYADGNGCDFASVTGSRIIPEIDLSQFKKVSEINISVTFDQFILLTDYDPYRHQMEIKIGPYKIYIRSTQPSSSAPFRTEFHFKITIPENDFQNATCTWVDPSGGPGLVLTGERFEIRETEFDSSPVVTFIAKTGSLRECTGSTLLIVRSLEISVSGELL